MLVYGMFQHTAARRRLGMVEMRQCLSMVCFNTQPPEGGWFDQHRFSLAAVVFQHTAARRRLGGL